jgi:thymidylate kinase
LELIAFSGLDGAGKSTQIEILKKHFELKSQRVEVFWSRGGYTPGMELLKRLMRKSGAAVVPTTSGNSQKRDNAFKRKSIRKIWLTMAILDLILNYSIILRIKNLFGKLLICDRYLIDTQLDFDLNFPAEKISTWFLWKILKKTAPHPRFHFVLTVSVRESQKRSVLKNEPFPDPPEVLKYRLSRYVRYCEKHNNCFQIDCEKSIDEVEKQISTYLDL